jgi:L-lactate dehydrogenase complex protein LldG
VVLDREAKIERLRTLMTAVRTEVHMVPAEGWIAQLQTMARERKWRQMAYGPTSAIGEDLAAAWQAAPEGLPELVGYTEGVEAFKARLFGIDAGITTTLGAVADTGALILWPTAAEPRLLSLVPPVHIALVAADGIFGSLDEAMAVQRWSEGMPTNALLVSGPSKTADIEFTLVYGVHGPKELIVLIVT